MKKIRNIVLVLALLSVVSIVSFKSGQKSEGTLVGNQNQMDLSLMWKVKDKISSLYLDKDKVDQQKMTYGAIQGMVASLDDPYTVFLPPSANKNSNEDLAGEFGGVGIQLGYTDDILSVMAPLPKTPAAKAGIEAKDLILKITDKANNVDRDTNGISLSEAVDLIRGKIGTDVTLKMFRKGKDAPFDVTLKRDNIVVPSAELEWKEIGSKKIAWVRLSKFTERLYQEWPEVVDKINEDKKTNKNFGGVVLDLRNNPGGFLDASVMVASDLLSDGVVVKQQSSDGKVEIYSIDKSKGALINDKLVVLVNGGSASAAEILAGALKDYNRAKLVGEKTFGKGTVQAPEQFSDGSGLHVTIAKWLLPNGNNIHKIGVDPDVEVKNDSNQKEDLQLNKAIEVLSQ
ncbi:MAG: S41 family peptidase [Candidatus Shapirobacteria bacterium]|nr:S41 family peptidase [Candidatus Shapirobacteria bacterium]